ncbi:MAG TPA: DUF3263 domain-containing protein [Micromonosporaceae bacterium]|nr:DUF3263 domain-containing protein [Micromonosporaceae bacterium]
MQPKAGARITGKDLDEFPMTAPEQVPERQVTATPPAPPSDRGADPEPSALTTREERILAFERRWWRRAGSKEQAIRDELGLSPTRYYQLLNRVLDNPAAMAFDPILVKRLRRIRAARARVRGGPRGTSPSSEG